MEYKNLHNNYFINYEDIFKKVQEYNKGFLKIYFNTQKYILENIEVIELKNNYFDMNILSQKKNNYSKNFFKNINQSFDIIQNIKTKECIFQSSSINKNLEGENFTFDFEGIILNDNFDISKSNIITLSLAIKTKG